MKAPDKLYFDGESLACKLPIFSSCDIEYIRKDALLEWAKETYKATENNNEISELFKQGALYELHKVINKIESL